MEVLVLLITMKNNNKSLVKREKPNELCVLLLIASLSLSFYSILHLLNLDSSLFNFFLTVVKGDEKLANFYTLAIPILSNPIVCRMSKAKLISHIIFGSYFLLSLYLLISIPLLNYYQEIWAYTFLAYYPLRQLGIINFVFNIFNIFDNKFLKGITNKMVDQMCYRDAEKRLLEKKDKDKEL